MSWAPLAGMQEGTLSLMQMAKVSVAVSALSAAGLSTPHSSLVRLFPSFPVLLERDPAGVGALKRGC